MLNISHAGSLVNLQPFRRNSLLKCVSQREIVKNLPKPLILGAQGSSTSIPQKQVTSVCYNKQHDMSMFICNCFHASRANIGKKPLVVEYPSDARVHRLFLKPMGSRTRLLKSTFDAKNFVRRLSLSISSYFVAIHSLNVRHSQKLRKSTQNPFLRGEGFKVVQGHRC